MAIYAIGDLQGCFQPLERLLTALDFRAGRDRLLFTGDLVNRGPESLQCLRFVKDLGASATTVLGNHDLHLLAAVQTGEYGGRDTLDDILSAPDRDELLAWLRLQPLAYEEPTTGILLVHAGLVPQWSKTKTLKLGREVQQTLSGPRAAAFLEKMYGDRPDRWADDLRGLPRLRCIVNALTRLRYCDAGGRMDLKPKGPPGTQPEGQLPWFTVPGRRSARSRIVCGHWSSVGQVHWPEQRVWTLDTGCVWGGCLTALNLETGELIRSGCEQYLKPRKSGQLSN